MRSIVQSADPAPSSLVDRNSPAARPAACAIAVLSRRLAAVSLLLGAALVYEVAPFAQSGLGYDLVYVRAPRYGDTTNTKWPDVFNPFMIEKGSDLMLLRADGTQSVLVSSGATGAVIDPCVSFDGEWVYYSYSPDVTPNFQYFHTGLPRAGLDVYRIHVPTRRIVRLTFQESTPNTGVVLPSLPYGVFNTGACPVSGGRVVFTSTRNQFRPVKNYTALVSQLFVMDEDGANVTAVAPMTLGAALHPFQLADGRIAFSTYESQGIRDQRLWGLWAIWPDGRQWEPLMSAFGNGLALHFATQLSGGDLVVEDYYNANNNGFGSFYRFAAKAPTPAFYPASVTLNPKLPYVLEDGRPYFYRNPFTPKGLVPMTPFTTPHDTASPPGPDGVRAGKGTHPSGAPGGDMLVAWTFGPANNLKRPTPVPYYDSGIYLMPGGGPATSPGDLIPIKNDPAYNEQWPRALVAYRAIYGVDAPRVLPWLPNAGSPSLPAGTPYGIIGTSSLYRRESAPGIGGPWDGLDSMIPASYSSSNWSRQGADAGKYSNSEIWGVRILTEEPTSQGGTRQWFNHANERLRILGEIPVRKGAVLDPEGNPDTSFSAKIPADTPFTFQLIDAGGRTLAMAQTWHQVRPGETRTSCGGCHAHSQAPLAFATSAAASLPPMDLTRSRPRDVEFLRDIRPLLQRSCVSCHSGTAAAASLDLNDLSLYPMTNPSGNFPGDYARLARDPGARWGIKPWTSERGWRYPQASRYIRKLQSRRSLLAWYVAGRRLDGWSNASWPSESIPGDPRTLPAGTTYRADVNFVDTVNHGGLLSASEQRRVFTWIDLGAPINLGAYFQDEQRPTLTVSVPRPNQNVGPLTQVRVGVTDVGSGLDRSSLRVQGLAVGAPVEVAPGVFTFSLMAPLTSGAGRISVSVRDFAGNTTRQDVRFTVK